MGTVTREVVLPAGVDEVWEAITDPRRLAEWFGADVDLDLWPGGNAEFRGDDGEVRRGVVEEVEPCRRLAYRWWPGVAGAGAGDGVGDGVGDGGTARRSGESRVELTIEEVASGTRLVVVEAPVPALGPQACASGAGWTGRLRALVWATALCPVAG
jgi:uncharacterized protein YndB with AHSA1/START domain